MRMRMCKTVWYKSGISFVSLAGMKRTVSLKHSLYPFNFFSDTPKMVKYQWQKNWTIIQHDKTNSKNHFPTGYTAWYKTTPAVKRHSTTNSALLIPTPFDNIHLLVLYDFMQPKNHIQRASWAAKLIITISPCFLLNLANSTNFDLLFSILS